MPKQNSSAKTATGGELAKLARDLIYMSGASFSCISIYSQAQSEAQKILNTTNCSGSAKNFLKANFEKLKAYIDQNKSNLVVNKKSRKKVPSKQSCKPFKSAGVSFAATNEFLLSYEWRKIRMVVLKKYGARCQCCGASPATGAVMHVDHIKPRKLFPHLALDVDNLQVLCHECNHGKGNWDQTDWRDTEF